MKKFVGLCVLTGSVGSFQAPAFAEDPALAEGPTTAVLASSFQKTCDNITASVNLDGSGVELQADCLDRIGERAPTLVEIRGVHKQSDGYVSVVPTLPVSGDLQGCSVTEIVSMGVMASIDLVCDNVGSTLHLYEIHNINGVLTYDAEKVNQFAAQKATASVTLDGEPVAADAALIGVLQERVEGLLARLGESSLNAGDRSRTTDQGNSHILLESSAVYDQDMVVSLTPIINNDGSGSITGSVSLYRDADAALAEYETAVESEEVGDFAD